MNSSPYWSPTRDQRALGEFLRLGEARSPSAGLNGKGGFRLLARSLEELVRPSQG